VKSTDVNHFGSPTVLDYSKLGIWIFIHGKRRV